MVNDMSSREILITLERLLAELIALRHAGATCDRMGRAQGFVDGYTCALLDAGVATHAELLEVVRRQRAIASGAATREDVAPAPRSVAA